MKSLNILGLGSIVSVVALSSCGGRDVPFGDLPGNGGTSNTGGNSSIAGAPSTGGTTYTVDASAVITLKRDVCFGSCPVYALQISGDGSVVYQGTQYVKVVGAASEQIAPSDVQALVDQMMQANYFSLSVPDTCALGIWTDAATDTTSLTLMGQTHTVVHYQGNQCAPAALTPLENRIDAVTNSAQWVNCGTTSGTCTN